MIDLNLKISVVLFNIAIIFFISNTTYGQDVEFNSQAEVDAFDPTITIINGGLKIGGDNSNNDIVDLSNLSNIVRIEDYFFIRQTLLTNLDGLSNLSYVGDIVHCDRNYELVNFQGLNNLTFVGHNFSIWRNEKLLNTDGLSNLSFVGGDLDIDNNDLLTNLNGFSSLTSTRSIYVEYNESLIDISGLSNCTSIDHNLFISNNSSLTSLTGLKGITHVVKDLRVNGNAVFNLNDLSNITFVGNNTEIIGNPNLTNLDGLENIVTYGSELTIEDNPLLTDCCGIQDYLSDPGFLPGDLVISQNSIECSSEEEVIDGICGLILNVEVNSPCIAADNGSIGLRVRDYLNVPFNFEWERVDDGFSGSGSSMDDYFFITMLREGTYNITVTNATPDTAIREGIVLSSIDGSIFEIVQVISTNSSNEMNNGALDILLSGGTAPFDLSWSGPSAGSLSNMMSNVFNLPNLMHGVYTIRVEDSSGNAREVTLTLLDETVANFPCVEPLDIVIINDVSGSVDAIEYDESKQFFIDFVNEINMGLDNDDSRVGIIEWAGVNQQSIRIPITGDLSEVNGYINLEREFSGGTYPHEAFKFGKNYLDSEAREGVEKVLVLSTDGYENQVSPSLIALADQFKAEGYHIVTIAFDDAFSISTVRSILREVASVDALAPGAPAYSLLNQELASSIINLYICPIDPGSSATVYFNRDGAIDITDITTLGDCPFPEFIDLTFTIKALKELSIPSGAYVTFYHNDPNLFGATPILNWRLPCAIPAGGGDSFTITLPVDGPSEIFAVFNDDGSSISTIQFPITTLSEIAYSNNIDFESFCLSELATLQVNKYTTTRTPACDTTVNYTVNVCNISEVDATGVKVVDDVPIGFNLLSSVVNVNGCSSVMGETNDIPAGCCLSISYSYDAADALLGYYGSQDVYLNGPSNQVYFHYYGSNSTAEDVIIDGNINCPSTAINFAKSVNSMETCDDGFVTFTYTINNEMNIPLQGVYFTEELPSLISWTYQAYNQQGLTIANIDLDGNVAQFIIDEIEANTTASFSLDVSLGVWLEDGDLSSKASISNVPDPMNGGLKSINSNNTSTQIIASPIIEILDTIYIDPNINSFALNAIINTSEGILWTSSGDGTFTNIDSESTSYTFGIQDVINKEVHLFVLVETDCNEVGENVVVIIKDVVSNNNESKLTSRYKVMPNPSYSELAIIPIEPSTNFSVVIYNSSAMIVGKYNMYNGESLNTVWENLPPGLYVISINDNVGTSLLKWVKL